MDNFFSLLEYHSTKKERKFYSCNMHSSYIIDNVLRTLKDF